MNYSLAFQQGVYGFIVAAAFLLCAGGLMVITVALAGIVGSVMKRLGDEDDGGEDE